MSEWQPVSELPEIDLGKNEQPARLLFYSKDLGVNSGTGGSFRGYRFVSIACFHGNAIEHWGVTHFMHLPAPPPSTTTIGER